MTARWAISAGIALAVAVAAFALLAPAGGDDGAGAEDPADAGWSEGRAVFAAMGCGSCHRLAAAGSTGTIGPDLDQALAAYDRESLGARIVRVPGQGFSTMPDDFGERMTDAELDALVSFLLAAR